VGSGDGSGIGEDGGSGEGFVVGSLIKSGVVSESGGLWESDLTSDEHPVKIKIGSINIIYKNFFIF